MSSVLAAMQGSDEHALDALNDALANWPRDARLWFLRGAVHAGLQQHGHARADFVQSLTLAPDNNVARFMLGLLELMNGLVEQAAQTWLPIDRLPDDNALPVLKDGFLSLAADRFDDALEKLNRGMQLNREHPLINVYVRNVVEKIVDRSASSAPSADSDAQQHAHLLLSGYQNNQTRH
ncbi:tetratricopeptide repeat protein [Burkholderia sp. SRS-W-2-2016]|uniref:tetratricopeptide repeat protein n=1 Tax=Burkholderia sp. SRS-W-2-2016 TaxID=1926878 RepID=UPI0009FB3DFE|nr:tetratricopeptide repeat protein [Burkholderia sp. SRS-W-2-2016]